MARLKSGSGYIMVSPPTGYKGKTYIEGRYVYEHRLLVEQKIGRLLNYDEVIHHINGDKMDNRLENLEVLSPTTHNKKHRVYAKQKTFICPWCQKTKTIKASYYDWLLKKNRMAKVFCSTSCATHFQFEIYFPSVGKVRKEHGTPSSYRHCKCDLCRRGNNERMARFRRKKREENRA